MILFYKYGLISKQHLELIFSPYIQNSGYTHNGDKIEEDILNDMAKYQPLINNLMKTFNLEL